ncbi:glycosyltransferase family 2 protein [Agromyces badenianii]|uniref:glycosyltransferase family 2 protein n=1 Tax=Agromyces badenianii TaxID=2080742 RepID=UPI000D58FD81|nr:glycosyltransferase [Agromyces badenianii]PWC03803.1 glycosyl transferase family 2 [Agromyces badenianii]
MTAGPRFSILTPVYDPPIDVLRDTIDSVLRQEFTDWEWILVDDLSPNPAVRDLLRETAAHNSRVRVIERQSNGGIVVASQDALSAARGEFVALLDHDDLLTPNALTLVAATIDEMPSVDYVYSDEDKVSATGEFYDAFAKPDWSPERLRGQMYTSHFSVIRTESMRAVGGFREGFEGSQDHDLVLRVTEQARAVAHVPEILYHWRVVPGSTAERADAKPYAWESGLRAVQDHLRRIGMAAEAELGPVPGTYRIRRHPELERSVSVIIPTRGSSGVVHGIERVFVTEAVRSLLKGTRHTDLEVVVVYDEDTPQTVLDELHEIAGSRLTLVLFSGPFNFSRKCNEGYLAARGEVLLFLNDDVEVISDELIGQMLAPLNEPNVGMTGALLFYEDGLVQHGGHRYHEGLFTHAYQAVPGDSTGAFGALIVNREASGLTAACVAIPRSVFAEVGGFSEQLPANFNDVDFSKKVGVAGYRMLFLADARLYHYESRTREPRVEAFEHMLILQRWGNPAYDPYLA